MSGFDYSKWNNIEDSDDEAENIQKEAVSDGPVISSHVTSDSPSPLSRSSDNTVPLNTKLAAAAASAHTSQKKNK